MRRWVALCAAALLSQQAAAQGSYPNKPVRVIVSFTPGSATDIVGRVVGAKLSEYWGQPVVVENRSGAGGSIGSAAVARAEPDGYTLLINSSAHTVNPAIFANLPYDTIKDFTEGTPEVVAAIFSGSVDCYWVPISAGLSKLRAGKLRPLAVSSAKRNPQLPDVPTTGEAGVKGADTVLWFGLWGPAGMSSELVGKISADVRKALADPGVREKLINLGNDPLDMSPQEFTAFIREEIDVNKRILAAAGVKPQ